MSFALPAAPQPALPAPVAAPAPAPMFGTPTAAGNKPNAQPSAATFLGGDLTANPSNTGQKTLLGQ